MDTFTIDLIEKLFYKKIMRYNDLLHCFEEERKSLIEINIDRLWGLSKEKDEICEDITSIRQEIFAAANQGDGQEFFNLNRIIDCIPGKYRDRFKTLYLKILKLKGEIEVLRKQNIIYIDDSLEFLDEMISIISGESESKFLYNERCHYHKSVPHFFLNREV